MKRESAIMTTTFENLGEGDTIDGPQFAVSRETIRLVCDGSLDYGSTSKDLERVVKTRKTELLFLALFLKLLKPGGRAAVIVPDGVLFGSSKAHRELRRTLV